MIRFYLSETIHIKVVWLIIHPFVILAAQENQVGVMINQVFRYSTRPRATP